MFTLILGYTSKVGPEWLTLGYGLINLVMYSMEVTYLITGALVINMELVEIGPVELELGLTLVILGAGVFGNTCMIKPVIDSIPFLSYIFSSSVTWGHVLQVVFLLLILQTVFENCAKCTEKHGYSFVYYMIAPIIIWSTAYTGAFLETKLYLEYQVLFNVLYQMI